MATPAQGAAGTGAAEPAPTAEDRAADGLLAEVTRRLDASGLSNAVRSLVAAETTLETPLTEGEFGHYHSTLTPLPGPRGN